LLIFFLFSLSCYIFFFLLLYWCVLCTWACFSWNNDISKTISLSKYFISNQWKIFNLKLFNNQIIKTIVLKILQNSQKTQLYTALKNKTKQWLKLAWGFFFKIEFSIHIPKVFKKVNDLFGRRFVKLLCFFLRFSLHWICIVF
jgi:hypothetical protein